MEGGREGRGDAGKERNMHGKHECRDAGSHHAAFKQDGHIIHAIIEVIV